MAGIRGGARTILVGLLLCALAACSDFEDPCDPTTPDWTDGFTNGCGIGKICLACEPLGWASNQGYCEGTDYASDPSEYTCKNVWGPASGGGGSCNGDTSACPSAWSGTPGSQASYSCMAACAEASVCNQPGVDANCAVVAGYGQTANCATCR